MSSIASSKYFANQIIASALLAVLAGACTGESTSQPQPIVETERQAEAQPPLPEIAPTNADSAARKAELERRQGQLDMMHSALLEEGKGDADAVLVEMLKTLRDGEIYPILVVVTGQRASWGQVENSLRRADVGGGSFFPNVSGSVVPKASAHVTPFLVRVAKAADFIEAVANVKKLPGTEVVRLVPVAKVVVRTKLTVQLTKPTFFGFPYELRSGSTIQNFSLPQSEAFSAGVRLALGADLSKEPGYGFVSQCDGVSAVCMAELRKAGLLDTNVAIDDKATMLRHYLSAKIVYALSEFYLKSKRGTGHWPSERIVENIKLEFTPGVEFRLTDDPNEPAKFFALPQMVQTKSLKINPATGIRGALLEINTVLQ